MPNFKIIFITEFIEKIEGIRTLREGQEFSRVISAPDKQIAEKIANAMLGEEVFCLPLYLGQVLSVKIINLKPQLNAFCDCCVWERVLHRLRLILDQEVSGQDTFNGFKYFSPDDSGKKTKVGLRFTKTQRDRLSSINL